MPSKSPEQRRLIEAAAPTPGEHDGVPQAVGREFVAGAEPVPASGVIFTTGKKILLLLRNEANPTWGLPGGGTDSGENLVDSARRECLEKTGFDPLKIEPFARRIKDGVDYTTFTADVADEFTPILNGEHTAYQWIEPHEALNLPDLHPGLRGVLIKATGHELDTARQIRDGELTSPQRFRNMHLYDMRITGTGAAYRTKGEEFVWRDPSLYLNEDFLARCNGLPVIFEHPENATMDSEEFSNRIVGTILLPHIKGQEVWGIAKIYDDATVNILKNMPMSTSPNVELSSGQSFKVILDEHTQILIEGVPSLLDHLAICEQGVWDKAGEPKGIIAMPDEKLPEETAAKDDAFHSKMDSFMDSIMKRMDSFEEKLAGKELAADSKKCDDGEEDRKEIKTADDAEAKEAKERADAATAEVKTLKEKIADMDEKMPKALDDAEAEELAETQHKADSLASAFGEVRSVRPIPGEKPQNYRRRLLDKYKAHSPNWKDVDLAKADSSVLAVAERQIVADAFTASDRPDIGAGSGLREIKRRGELGHTITEFRGDISETYAAFKAPSLQVSGFNTKGH
jgi:8-oxo-dGTP pyrophosphatase MutT (NUDIX family)